MATSTIETSISLNKVAQILNYDLFSFNGFDLPDFRITDACAAPWEQSYGDLLSRDDLAQAVFTAEEMISEQLGYNILPRYETQELQTLRWKTPYKLSPTKVLQTDNKGFLIDIASRGEELLGTLPIVRISTLNSGFLETATIDLSAHRLIDPNELKFYYKDTDVEITDFVVKDKGMVRTASTPIYNIGKWSMLNAIDFVPLTWDDDDSYETELDVYRIFPDRTNPVKVLYNPDNQPCADDDGDCMKGFAKYCGYVEHKKFGYFKHTAPTTPNSVEVDILSGFEGRDKSVLDRKFEIPVVALAVSLLTKKPSCDQNDENALMSKWQKSTLEIDQAISRVLVLGVLNNIFGVTTYGGYLAEQFVKSHRLWNR